MKIDGKFRTNNLGFEKTHETLCSTCSMMSKGGMMVLRCPRTLETSATPGASRRLVDCRGRRDGPSY